MTVQPRFTNLNIYNVTHNHNHYHLPAVGPVNVKTASKIKKIVEIEKTNVGGVGEDGRKIGVDPAGVLASKEKNDGMMNVGVGEIKGGESVNSKPPLPKKKKISKKSKEEKKPDGRPPKYSVPAQHARLGMKFGMGVGAKRKLEQREAEIEDCSTSREERTVSDNAETPKKKCKMSVRGLDLEDGTAEPNQPSDE